MFTTIPNSDILYENLCRTTRVVFNLIHDTHFSGTGSNAAHLKYFEVLVSELISIFCFFFLIHFSLNVMFYIILLFIRTLGALFPSILKCTTLFRSRSSNGLTPYFKFTKKKTNLVRKLFGVTTFYVSI